MDESRPEAKAWHFDDNQHGNAASTGMRGGTGCRDWTDRSRPLPEVDEAHGSLVGAAVVVWWRTRASQGGGPAGQGPCRPPGRFKFSPIRDLGKPGLGGLGDATTRPPSFPTCQLAASATCWRGSWPPSVSLQAPRRPEDEDDGLAQGIGGTDAGGWEVGRLVVCLLRKRTSARNGTNWPSIPTSEDQGSGRNWRPSVDRSADDGPGSEEGGHDDDGMARWDGGCEDGAADCGTGPRNCPFKQVGQADTAKQQNWGSWSWEETKPSMCLSLLLPLLLLPFHGGRQQREEKKKGCRRSCLLIGSCG